ncbi:hypothetical protein WR25_25019 [Diploscapter pachys]|uniref:U3 small nucleolar ribonucleoprotein protein IMP3 n=1 Tax=Diploscapter pachys TaxID=2018661 RepID=A0A2A2JZX3_9BILA|nr:hypothetical protein WR25_25019 [Diploscapter pachys]
MVRKLKFNEGKLLKKTNFFIWEEAGLVEYHVTKREHYALYNSLAAEVRQIADLIKELSPEDPFREKVTKEMLSRLYTAGVIATADTAERLNHVSGSSFARRRLPVVMKFIGMVDSVRTANQFVEQGHVRVGPKLVTDPAFMVTRPQEDTVTWTNASKIKQHVETYNDTRDDFDLI